MPSPVHVFSPSPDRDWVRVPASGAPLIIEGFLRVDEEDGCIAGDAVS